MKGIVLAGALLALVLASCSQSDSATHGTGGAPGSGGTATQPASGGATGTGGGAGDSGGAIGAGGVRDSGGASGGTVAGAPGSGGVTTARGGAGGAAAGGADAAVTAQGGNAGADAWLSGGATGRDGGPTGSGGASSAGGSGKGGTGEGGGGPGGAGGGTSGGTGGSGAGGSTGCPALPPPPTGGVAGTMITFNDDGGWCWYQDERAVVDAKNGKLVIGSVGFKGSRVGNIEAVIYDIAKGTKSGPSKLGSLSVDDHNAPAFVVTPDGKYAAMWAGHNQDCKSYFSVYDGSSWAAQKSFDWTTQGCSTSASTKITYANMWILGTDLVSFVRSVETSPNYLISKDNGASWSFGGRLTSTPQVGYVAGYYKYWGNNVDRIDFLGTESHPRDNDTSLYHGYVNGGKVYNSAGTVIDDNLADKTAKNINQFTQAFKTGSTVGSVKLEHAWNHDLVRYGDGTVAFLGQGRVTGTGSTDPDKRMIYGRWDGTSWKLTYIGKLGPKLYADEQDYTGLGALHPDNPHIIYISSVFDPSNDTTQTSKHEIYQGVTCDNGATWKWVAVTKGSTVDNLRPIVPKWDADHTALLWMRGTYTTAQNMTMTIVGTISGP
jgi:hypothetical protein